MKPIYRAWLIQIEVTNACHLSCAHCTRAVPHIRKPYFANLDFVEKALRSLDGWKRGVGCMGGEPTLHPQFPEICALYRRYFPKKQCGLFTAGGKRYEEHKGLIDETFGIIHYNDHEMIGVHQPVMVASRDVIKDDKLREELIDRCWLQTYWSPSITPKGAFFCEVAGMFDMLFDGPGGYPVEPGWWKKSVGQFKDQRDRYCNSCSIPIPMEKLPTNLPYDLVSISNAKRLLEAGSPLAAKGNIRVLDQIFTREDIERLRRQPNLNKTPYVHTKLKEQHYWFRTLSKKYLFIALFDRLKMSLGVN